MLRRANGTPAEEKPRLQDAYKVFLSKLSASESATTGLIKASVSSQSPVLAQQWVTWLVEDLNDSIRGQEVKEAKRAVTFLEEKLKTTVSVDMRAMFFRLIQQQTETIMLANVKADYLFRIVDPAIIPEIKSSPSKSVICIFGALFALLAVQAIVALVNTMDLGIALSVRPSRIIIALSVAVASGLIAGLAPARKAARMEPVEAMRTNA
jgi:hypothetical protein